MTPIAQMTPEQFLGMSERVGVPSALLFGGFVFMCGVFVAWMRWFMRRSDRQAEARDQALVRALDTQASTVRRLTAVVLATHRATRGVDAVDPILSQLWDMERLCTTCPLQSFPEEERSLVVERLRACMARGDCDERPVAGRAA